MNPAHILYSIKQAKSVLQHNHTHLSSLIHLDQGEWELKTASILEDTGHWSQKHMQTLHKYCFITIRFLKA